MAGSEAAKHVTPEYITSKVAAAAAAAVMHDLVHDPGWSLYGKGQGGRGEGGRRMLIV